MRRVKHYYLSSSKLIKILTWTWSLSTAEINLSFYKIEANVDPVSEEFPKMEGNGR